MEGSGGCMEPYEGKVRVWGAIWREGEGVGAIWREGEGVGAIWREGEGVGAIWREGEGVGAIWREGEGVRAIWRKLLHTTPTFSEHQIISVSSRNVHVHLRVWQIMPHLISNCKLHFAFNNNMHAITTHPSS